MIHEQLDIHMQKLNLDADLTPPLTRVNSKWITNQNVKCKTVKRPEDIWENLCGLRFGNEFLGTTPKAWTMKEITDKPHFIKIKFSGVPVVARWLTNPTRNHEVSGSIPDLAHWVKDPALLWAVVWFTDRAQILHCCGSWCRPVAIARIRPLACEPPYAAGVTLEKAKRQKKKR